MERKYPQIYTNLLFTDLESNLVQTLHLKSVDTIKDLMEHVYANNNDISLNEIQLEAINEFFKRHFKEIIMEEEYENSYRFRIINNHIIVDFPSSGEFLLDTGSPHSYLFDIGYNYLEIDKIYYPLRILPNFDLKRIYNIVGSNIKGIIGLDILKRTNITLIRRDESGGDIFFSALPCCGKEFPLLVGPYIKMEALINNHKAIYLVDTGAYISYIRHNLIKNNNPVIKEVNDYSPSLGDLKSNLYKTEIKIGEIYELEVAVNKRVEEYSLDSTNSDVVGGILHLFKKEISFNLQEKWVVIN